MPHVDYGNDTECASDLTFSRTEVTGETMMAQAMLRRFTTPRGTLINSPDYGYDLRQFVKATTPAESIINGNVENEALKDERVADVTVQTLFNEEAERLEVTIVGFGSEGPFDLTIGISEVTVELLRTGGV